MQRDLSIKGRVVLATTLGLSKFLFVSKILVPPNYIFQKIQKIQFHFLWHGKAYMVSRDVCYMSAALGGLNVPDLK